MKVLRQEPYQVLFLGNGNAARSILAEAYLNWAGKDRFVAISAGRRAVGEVDPLALEILEQYGFDARSARSKGWEEFFSRNIDFLLTLDHFTFDEAKDFWPAALVANWRIGDPTLVFGELHARRRAFIRAFAEVTQRVNSMLDLSLSSLNKNDLKARLEEIGRRPGYLKRH